MVSVPEYIVVPVESVILMVMAVPVKTVRSNDWSVSDVADEKISASVEVPVISSVH